MAVQYEVENGIDGKLGEEISEEFPRTEMIADGCVIEEGEHAKKKKKERKRRKKRNPKSDDESDFSEETSDGSFDSIIDQYKNGRIENQNIETFVNSGDKGILEEGGHERQTTGSLGNESITTITAIVRTQGERIRVLENQIQGFDVLKMEIQDLKLQLQQQNNNRENENGKVMEKIAKKDIESTGRPNLASYRHSMMFKKSIRWDAQETSLPDDTYTFISCSRSNSWQFCFGIAVFLIQFILLVLVFAYYYYRHYLDGTLFNENSSFSLKLTQYVATWLAIMRQNDFRLGLMQIQEGVNEEIFKIFAHCTVWKWRLSSALRIIIGVMGILASYLIIIDPEDVIEILMNFAALEGLIHFDNEAFDLSTTGIFGIGNRAKTKEIKEKTYKTRNKSSVAQYLMVLLLVVSFGLLLLTNYFQYTNYFVSKQIRVEFADNAAADIGVYSGVYQIDPSLRKYDLRVRYHEVLNINNNNKKMIAFCNKGYWTLSEEKNKNPCEKYLARSGETYTYLIEKTQNTLWTAAQNSLPLDFVVIEAIEPEEENKCKSNPSVIGAENFVACQGGTVCPSLSISPEMLGESHSLQKDTLFNISQFENKFYLTYGRPIYVGHKHKTSNSTHQHYYLMLFTGRRWIVTSTNDIEPLSNITGKKDKEMKAYFSKGFRASDLNKNEGVLSISEATLSLSPPIDLKWYGVKYTNFDVANKFIPPASTIERDNTAIVCSDCNNDTQKCHNKGHCGDDETCECLPTTTGSFCQYPFIAKECILDELLDEGVNISFDNSTVSGRALKRLGTDTSFKCEYATWVQRYALAVLFYATKKDVEFESNVKECNFRTTKIGCDTGMTIESIQISDYRGFVPSEMLLLTSLKTVSLSGVYGPFPTEFDRLDKLETLTLGFDTNTPSLIASEIGLLNVLEEISLQGVYGPIPTELGGLDKLEIVSLGMNELTGTIPSELGQLTRLISLNLSINELTGTIPSELAQLTRLVDGGKWGGLNLNNNALTGEIPSEFFEGWENVIIGGNNLTVPDLSDDSYNN